MGQSKVSTVMINTSRMADQLQWLEKLRDLAQEWIERTEARVFSVRAKGRRGGPKKVRSDQPNLTDAYIDLMFAFGFVRVGATELCDQLMQNAILLLGTYHEVQEWLGQAFQFRINEGRAKRPHAGPLPAALLSRQEELQLLSQYGVDRLRERSSILEPTVRVSPYDRWIRDPEKKLAVQARTWRTGLDMRQLSSHVREAALACEALAVVSPSDEQDKKSTFDCLLTTADELLLNTTWDPREHYHWTKLVGEYLNALRRLPWVQSNVALLGMVSRLPAVCTEYTTQEFYSVSHLAVVDAIVMTAIQLVSGNDPQ
jgi:hypothetical protein